MENNNVNLIAIDTCVFLDMIQYNQVYKNGFVDESTNEKFVGKVAVEKFFKSKLNERVIAAETLIKNYQGKYPNINWDTINFEKNFDKKLDLFYKIIKGNERSIHKTYKTSDYIEYEKLVNSFKTLKYLECVKDIYINNLDGKIKMALMPTTRMEIFNHIKVDNNISLKIKQEKLRFLSNPPKGHANNIWGKDTKYYDLDEVVSLIKMCQNFTINDEKDQEFISQLSNVIRGLDADMLSENNIERPNKIYKNLVPMSKTEDHNYYYRVGEHYTKELHTGDSLIMAEAIYAGLPLVTNNKSDFIGNGKGFRREYILQLIKQIMSNSNMRNSSCCEFINENSLPYLPEEILNFIEQKSPKEKI